MRSTAHTFALIAALLASGPLGASDSASDDLTRCARIASDNARLACFDRLAAKIQPQLAVPSATGPVSSTTMAIASNERGRAVDDMRFRMTPQASAIPEGSQVLIAAPAPDAGRPKPLLAIACVDRITRLQLITHPPVAPAQTQVSLFLDGRPLASAQSWQVLEGGRVIDAGRGLPAIDLLRRMKDGSELRVQSDLLAIDGLHFDATGLSELLELQRKACRW